MKKQLTSKIGNFAIKKQIFLNKFMSVNNEKNNNSIITIMLCDGIKCVFAS